MPGPNFKILNRAQAEADAKDLIDIATPVLKDLVDYSTWVCLRCMHAGDTTYEDLPSFVLYLHVIEMIDGIHVLLSRSCCEPAVPLLRSSFEAFLSLRYLFQDDYRNRSLSWLYFDNMREIKKTQQLDPDSDRGKELARITNGLPDLQVPELTPEQLEYVRSLPQREFYQEIEEEYQRTKQDRGIRNPEWYTLFDGPQNRQELAKSLSQEPLYVTVYRDWSASLHGGDSSRYIETLPDGTAVGHQLRLAENLPRYAYLAGFFIWAATDSMLLKFRPHEPNHAKWSAEMKRKLVDLAETEVDVKRGPMRRR